MKHKLLESNQILVGRSGVATLVFPSLSLAKGEKLLLLGPSGSGKTTLLSVLAGLLKPTRGNVYFDGVDIYKISTCECDQLRGRHFGFVFQSMHLLASLNLRQNIILAADMARVSLAPGRVEQLLEELNLSDKAQRKPHALSQGEQQRAAIARALINNPALVIADEPTSALDDANAEAVMLLLESQAREAGAALLVATHDQRILSRFTQVVRLTATVPEVI